MPYEANISAALQRLREDVFARGDYFTAAPVPKPRSIEELLEQEGENGTHSILDIMCISARPKFGAISPFPQSELVNYFDTDKPTRSVIEDRYEWGSLDKFTSDRWQASISLLTATGHRTKSSSPAVRGIDYEFPS